jgi:hypothetical protein
MAPVLMVEVECENVSSGLDFKQNHKFYGKSCHCPHCGEGPETFLHVVTCSCPEVETHRAQQQAILWKLLRKSNTPNILLQLIQRGVLSCNPSLLSDSKSLVVEENSSSCSPCSITALSFAAFEEQDRSLGWDQFLRGRISQRWRDAFRQNFLSRNSRANDTQWAGSVIRAILDYSLSLWQYRCKLLHGRTSEEAE